MAVRLNWNRGAHFMNWISLHVTDHTIHDFCAFDFLCWCWWKWLSNYTPNFMPVPLTLNYPQTEILLRIPRFLLQHQNSKDEDCPFCKRPKKATLFDFYMSAQRNCLQRVSISEYEFLHHPVFWLVSFWQAWMAWLAMTRTHFVTSGLLYWIWSRNVMLLKQLYC